MTKRPPGVSLSSRPEPEPDTRTIESCLSWLAAMDRNGLWGEYLENFTRASEEHGEIVLDALQDVIEEMLE